MTIEKKNRRDYRNISLLQLVPYMLRFPASAWVSLLHRGSGLLMFILLPAIIWAFDASLSSEYSFAKLKNVFEHGFSIVPGWFLKLVVLAVLWAFIHHLIAGLRFLVLDVNHASVEKRRSGRSARWVLISSVVLTVALGAKLFGLY
ncbi:succinate dehydrogenase, cytochrome b556 subunit [Acidovorax sp. NCPPB 3576]|uniref:succinate dehydrogenase, cytochrome b556 subunit n=1 Tax=Acidovorax sp. NCPPB 3576 TaxID=2940488 RepID=UPI00234BCC4E|nr:succinate dehydrogenase, cytochrome b556 subunit [Acidovorax sp. NCPPB 3576]WCM86360.1 succinate dehydrogenase, cytochrome b556 subunit [Acidovorax sp. NCPPB 3576]